MGVLVNAHTLEGDFEGITFQGETIESVFTLCNSLDSSENFSISSNNKWMETRPLSVYLPGNQCEEIYAFTTPFPYTEPGNYEIEVRAQGDHSVTKTFYLTVVQGHKIIINTLNNPIKTTECQEEMFEIELTNTGSTDERAVLSVEGINPNWIELSSEEIFLPKKETRLIELKVLIPCNQETGLYEFVFTAELIHPYYETGVKREKQLSLKIENAQEISIENKSFSSCNDLETTDSIKITNNGLIDDEITLELEGPEFISLKQNTLSLNAGQSKEIELEFNLTESETGSHNFKIKAYSDKFNQLYEKELNLELEDCFNLSIEKGAWQDSACIESNPEISYIIKNNGTRKTEIKAGITGIKAELEKNSVGLNPGDSTEIRAKLEFEKKGENNFVFIADSEKYTLTLEGTITTEDCYDTDSVVPSIEVCKNVPLTGKTVLIKNTGTKTQSFEISSDVSWIKLQENNFELSGSEQKSIFLIITPNADSEQESYSVRTRTENNQYTMSGKIKYLDEKTCFEIVMQNLQNSIDVNAGEGAINTIKVTNNGKTLQHVTFSVEEFNWVYFNPKEFDLIENETKEVYVYFNPPFDFKEEHVEVTVKGETDFGFKTEKTVEVNIFGGSVVLTINPEDIKVNSKEVELEDTNQNIVEITIEISNNTETSMKIINVKTSYPNSTYFIEDPVIKKGTTSEILLKFTASEELELDGLEIPIEIITDKGNYYKIVQLPKKSIETEEGIEGTEATGFVLFGEDQYLLVILVVIIVILIIMAAVKSDKDEENSEQVIDYSPDNFGKEDFQQEIKEIVTKKPAKKTKLKTKKKAKKKK